MQTSRQALARAIALSALVVAILAIGVVIASNTGGGDNGKRNHPGKQAKHQKDRGKSKQNGGGKGKIPATYTVKSGDTLTSIAADTGVSVVTIQQLNPDIDPQILVEGQELKLR
jgi:LysM repeat protein